MMSVENRHVNCNGDNWIEIKANKLVNGIKIKYDIIIKAEPRYIETIVEILRNTLEEYHVNQSQNQNR